MLDVRQAARVGLAVVDDEELHADVLARDQVISEMSERTRRLTYGRLLGRTQSELARSEGITQSAVSQALATAGAGALIEGFAQLQIAGTAAGES